MPTTHDLLGSLPDTRHLPEQERLQIARLEMQALTGGPMLTTSQGEVRLWVQAVEQAVQDQVTHHTCRTPSAEPEAVSYFGIFDAPTPGEVFFTDGALHVCRGVIVEAEGDEDHLVLALRLPEERS